MSDLTLFKLSICALFQVVNKIDAPARMPIAVVGSAPLICAHRQISSYQIQKRDCQCIRDSDAQTGGKKLIVSNTDELERG